MKIAVWHNLPSGGAKRALYYHVKGLVQRKHFVESWTLSTADSTYLPLHDLVTEHVVSFDWKPRIYKGGIGYLISQYLNALAQMAEFDETCKRCAQEIDVGGFDVVLVNSSILYYMPFVVRHLKTPKVLYLQEPFRPLYEANPILPWVSNVYPTSLNSIFRVRRLMAEFLPLQTLRVQAKEEWVNAHSCDRILVNSYYSRESVIRAYGCDAQVCYLGVDTTLFKHTYQQRERFIVGLGSFDKIKGIDLAIKSVALLSDPKPPLVWIANSGNESFIKEMTALAETLGVQFQIKMRISDADLVSILNQATLLLYTSHLEPFGFAPLEANACATPVVAVAEGGVRETVKDGINGFLVDRNPQQIAETLSKFLDNSELARNIGASAEQYVSQYWSEESSIDRLERHLKQVVHETNIANSTER